jgi:hypothetical protein
MQSSQDLQGHQVDLGNPAMMTYEQALVHEWMHCDKMGFREHSQYYMFQSTIHKASAILQARHAIQVLHCNTE